MDDRCPECHAPPGTCWSQSGSMGGKPSCYRDPLVSMTKEELIAEIKRLRNEASRM